MKKNRVDLWRDLESPEVVKLKWAEISILYVEDLDPESTIKWFSLDLLDNTR